MYMNMDIDLLGVNLIERFMIEETNYFDLETIH